MVYFLVFFFQHDLHASRGSSKASSPYSFLAVIEPIKAHSLMLQLFFPSCHSTGSQLLIPGNPTAQSASTVGTSIQAQLKLRMEIKR